MNGLTSEKFLNSRWWMGDMTLFEALAGGAFDPLKCQHTGKLGWKFSKQVKYPGVYPGRGTGARVVLDNATFTFPIMRLICPPPPHPPKKKKKFCLRIVFNFSLDSRNTQEKWKTKVMENLAGGSGCIMENVKVAYWLEHKCNVLIFVQKSQGAAGDVKPVPEPEDSSPVKPANNSSGCVVSWTVQNHKHLKLGPNVQLFMRRTKVSKLSSWKARRLAQLSSCEWVWIVKLKHALSVRFRR